MMLVADVPKPREREEQDWINDNGIRHREKCDCAGAEGERRNGDEGIGRVEVAADEEPSDDRAEPAAAEAPFVQQIEITFAPMCGSKTEPGDEREQQDKNG
jgi:hypothetical protein